MDVLLTNNPLAAERFKSLFEVDYREISYLDVLKAARDMVHNGAHLLTHPLSSSLKPNETPYKSIVVTNIKLGLDIESLQIIENSIELCKNFLPLRRDINEGTLRDFMEIDCALINKNN